MFLSCFALRKYLYTLHLTLGLSVLDDHYWLIEQLLWGVIIETGIVETIVHSYSKCLLRDLQSNC